MIPYPYIQFLPINYLAFFMLNLLFSTIVILLERKDPLAALAWLFFMTLFPGVGFFFYLLLAQNISKRKIFKYTAEESRLYASVLESQRRALEGANYPFLHPETRDYEDLILFHNRLSDSLFSQNNRVSFFFDGTEKFDRLFQDIREAKHHVHMLYYIIQGDSLGQKLFELLGEKASQGVEVRLLVDHVGGRHLPRSRVAALRAQGAEVCFFFPSWLRYFNLKGNYRNHRKITVIDGEVGYVGGFNVGNEYLGLKRKFGYWRDTHLRIEGDAVIAMQLRFFLDWRNASRKGLTLSPAYLGSDRSTGDVAVQIVSSGPDNINQQIKQGYLKMVHRAVESIDIQTPYFIPDESILEALRIAASSGVRVRLMIPRMPDHIFIYWATYSYAADLLPYGVEVYIYEKGFLHAKAILVDRKACSIGSCNFDIRSFKLNFEANAFIYDRQASMAQALQFEKDLLSCRRLTLEDYGNRPFVVKVKEAVSRLFSPLL
ncbi:cardiolipin synthase [Anaerotalea alkaliphila]|uniref:Cardiolipin synthase n=1 Tax=Anaerotalea alkaliphila TaxID=2662126 RepID=A0A7X5KMP3_9FIRM|nr:cardiolipin synthase [Anaerotalea alkaliphila]NDL66918.1 cardiolipin synthase [Anaerotalea alkaliphila]